MRIVEIIDQLLHSTQINFLTNFLGPPYPTTSLGRSGNVWISPKGSAMFSMALQFLPTTKLAEKMPLLQHLIAMAVVHGVKTIPGYEVGPYVCVCVVSEQDCVYIELKA